MNEELVVFILTHGRPDNVKTYTTIRKHGYTGKIYLVVDDEDKTLPQYIEKFGSDKVLIFNKKEVKKTFDVCDNFDNYKTIIYARNACFDLAKKLGIKYFVQLDDDYIYFEYRYFLKYEEGSTKKVGMLDEAFDILLEFYKNTNILSIAFSQGGDFIGGVDDSVKLKRKCMNSFLCSTDRPFKFIGNINEDVNTYVKVGSLGGLFFTTNLVQLKQMTTQANASGMTDVYKTFGTYLKSFYSVMINPSCVKIGIIQDKNPRVHHNIRWENAVPKVLMKT